MLEFIQELIQSIRHRASNPLLSSYVIAWVICNYPFVFVLFSDVGVYEKIEYLKYHFTVWDGHEFNPMVLIKVYLLPAALALIYVYALPRIFKHAYKYTWEHQRDLSIIKNEIDGVTLLTLEESASLHKEKREAEEKHAAEIHAKELEIKGLRYEVEKANNRLRNLLRRNAREVTVESLMEHPVYELVYNPKKSDGKKLITFRPDGTIGFGRNTNENTWRIENFKLEILDSEGRIHSRFVYDRNLDKLIHTNDADTRSIRGQIIRPAEGFEGYTPSNDSNA